MMNAGVTVVDTYRDGGDNFTLRKKNNLSPGSSITILHIDDEPDFLELSKIYLEKEHGTFMVNTAASAREALKKLEKGSNIDVIIADYKMPGMDGLQFLETLRKKDSSIPFIFFTGKGGEEVAIKALNLGATYYVRKGGDPKLLYCILSRAIINAVEFRRSQIALKEANQLLETIFEHTHVMVAYMDSQFNFRRVNRAYALADGKEPAVFPGKNHFDLYPNVENETIFKRVVETGKPHFSFAKAFEYAEHPERGTSYWDWSLVPIKRGQNEVTGLILTLQDVTARVMAERKLLQQRETRLRIIHGKKKEP
ncbi:MAG: response regulator [Candidatus Odinarchaeota archaeon]